MAESRSHMAAMSPVMMNESGVDASKLNTVVSSVFGRQLLNKVATLASANLGLYWSMMSFTAVDVNLHTQTHGAQPHARTHGRMHGHGQWDEDIPHPPTHYHGRLWTTVRTWGLLGACWAAYTSAGQMVGLSTPRLLRANW